MDTLLSDDNLEIGWIDGDGPTVFLSFTGIGLGMGGIPMPEFVGTTSAQGNAAAFISDTQRSWYNNFDFQIIADTLKPLISGRPTVAIGNSMGGFGAVLATKYFDIDTVLSFVPQFSVHPDIVPQERRWLEHRSRIASYRHRDLSGCFNSTTQYYLFGGDSNVEIVHGRLFPHADNIHHMIFPDARHNLAALLKKQGKLTQLIWDIVNGKHDKVEATLAAFGVYRSL